MALQLKSAQEIVNNQKGGGLGPLPMSLNHASAGPRVFFGYKKRSYFNKAVVSNSWYIRVETVEDWFQLGSSCYNRTSMYLTKKLDTFHHHCEIFPHLCAA